jgi:hypothetical protein
MSCRFFLIVAAVSLSGCSMFETPPPKPRIVSLPKPKPLEQVPKLVGVISMINTDGQFVLIESNRTAELGAGTALKCFRDSVETGVLAVGKERRGIYVTADIVKGEPQRGDQVFE